ncbi:MAG: hypothetical protein ABJ327_14975 [Litoreibacter sp.]
MMALYILVSALVMSEIIPSKEVAQYLLEQTGNAIMAGDFDTYLKSIYLPHVMETFHGRQVIETSEDARRVFEAMCTYLKSRGITQMVRHCSEACYQDNGTIASTHETRLLTENNILAQMPYLGLATLFCENGRWKVGSMQYAIEDSPRHSMALLS